MEQINWCLLQRNHAWSSFSLCFSPISPGCYGNLGARTSPRKRWGVCLHADWGPESGCAFSPSGEVSFHKGFPSMVKSTWKGQTWLSCQMFHEDMLGFRIVGTLITQYYTSPSLIWSFQPKHLSEVSSLLGLVTPLYSLSFCRLFVPLDSGLISALVVVVQILLTDAGAWDEIRITVSSQAYSLRLWHPFASTVTK